MLTSEFIQKLEDFIYKKPRSIQEIAQTFKKNWRTIDRYIIQIEKERGTIATRTFREGTRGALKVVYWAAMEKASATLFQEELEKEVLRGRKKEDFSAFDIFQHIPQGKKQLWLCPKKDERDLKRTKDFVELITSAKKQVLFFSGNVSFINEHGGIMFDAVEELVRKGIPIKVICKVDLTGKENIEKLLSLNFKHGKELVEVRHREQPIRGTIVDKNMLNCKEIKEPTGKQNELSRRVKIIYETTDKEWIEWGHKVFWKMFSTSVDAKKRLEEMDKIHLTG